MKISKAYEYVNKDNHFPEARELADELKWMQAKILRDCAEIEEIKKRIYYRRRQLGGMFKSHCGTFNNICRIYEIFRAYDNGEFDPEKVKDSEIIKDIAANFFPAWMWPTLDFFEYSIDGYDATRLNLSYIWGRKKSEKEVEFRISIPNPQQIDEHSLYYQQYGKGDSAEDIYVNPYMTRVYANTDIKTGEWRCTTYEWVGESYLNNEVAEKIENWAKAYIEKTPKTKAKGTHNGKNRKQTP